MPAQVDKAMFGQDTEEMSVRMTVFFDCKVISSHDRRFTTVLGPEGPIW